MTFEQLADRVIYADIEGAAEELELVLEHGAAPQAILDDALIPAMSVVGERFDTGQIFVPEMLAAALAMKRCMARLEPLLADTGAEPAGTVVIGTVRGDVHDIGKNLVAAMLKGAGFRVHDLGVNVSPERFVEAVTQHEPDIVGLSCLITTTMPAMRETVAALDAAGARPAVKILVGGAPVTEEFASLVAADGYAPNAGTAAHVASDLLAGAGRAG